jgi:hypothetical protein
VGHSRRSQPLTKTAWLAVAINLFLLLRLLLPLMNELLEAPAVPQHAQHRRPLWPILIVILWVIVAVAGLFALAHYANTPGAAAQPPQDWPPNSAITISPTGDTLVMFVHPHCPCTTASLNELQRLIAQCAEPVTTWVVLYKPAGAPAGWEQTNNWHLALAVPGARVISDSDGVEARRFHAMTSGQTLLYDSNGHLLFSGGITAQRGHEGENAGESSIVDLVNSAKSECRETPVFGCAIVPSSSESPPSSEKQ